jgi:hypothetical protein
VAEKLRGRFMFGFPISDCMENGSEMHPNLCILFLAFLHRNYHLNDADTFRQVQTVQRGLI